VTIPQAPPPVPATTRRRRHRIAARIRTLCETAGFAENFDALTGEGLRDRAYTWTASACLMLARKCASSAGGDHPADPVDVAFR
jgi:hypothetical protein